MEHDVCMNSERKFVFTDSTCDDRLTVVIPDVLDSNYGMYTWPCSPVLAQYIWHNRSWIEGKTVLELGAGTALPGIVAAKCGANVHLSDSATLSKCRENCQKSCYANGLHDVSVHGITWGRFDPGIFKLPNLDIVMASDCFYDADDFEDIVVTVAFLLERNEGAFFLFTYQERNSSRNIEHLLERWKLDSVQIPLSTFNADRPDLAFTDLPGNHTIHLFKLSTKDVT